MASNRLNIQFHAHALDRLRQRLPTVKKEWLRGRLRQRIRTELRKGAKINDRGALEVEVEPGMRAVCFPSLMGGWEVKTIIREGWEEDLDEMAKHRDEMSKLASRCRYYPYGTFCDKYGCWCDDVVEITDDQNECNGNCGNCEYAAAMTSSK